MESGWRQTTSAVARRAAHALETSAGSLRRSLKRSLGWIGPIRMLPYNGYGSHEQFYLKGRVLENKEIGSPKEADGRWQNLLAMYRRFTMEKIPDVTVRARCDGRTLVTRSDEEGYFEFRWRPAGPVPTDRLWHEIGLELDAGERLVPKGSVLEATGRVLVPPRDCTLGVISDVDDTILQTYATDLVKTARITFLNNARTRLPLPGVSAFYQALHRGGDGSRRNPLFYVSSSAWNLYDLLVDFLDLNHIPAGPVLLQNVNLTHNKLIPSGHHHKLEKISQILRTYPELPFVLLGDSGQRDPMLYHRIVADFPDRILAIYIRDIGRESRQGPIRQLIVDLAGRGVDMLLVSGTYEAAEHAARRGWIAADSLKSVVEDQVADVTRRKPLEQAA